MNRKEQKLFMELCAFRAPTATKIEALINESAATSSLLGMLFENRMAAVAYDVLKKTDMLDKTDREFRNSLRNASMFNEKWNGDFEECISFVSRNLDSCGVPYALLKGACLFGQYPVGCRTSNDIDVLVAPDDVGFISERLKDIGFRQGYLKNGIFVPATRQQIVESKMTRGETVPFIKDMGLPFMKFLEVDINFSLDYKNGDDGVLREMLSRVNKITVGNAVVSSLDKYDFLLHLCSHLYKEATTMPWIRMRRDMTFYKYCDIYSLLYDYKPKDCLALIERARHYEAEIELIYCLKSINSFFKLTNTVLRTYLSQNNMDLDLVVAPTEKKIYRYTESDPLKRFFKDRRTSLLKEVIS